MHQRHSIAALGFIEIRSRQNDGETVGGQMSESVPEFAARDGIDARGGLVEQQHARLRHQRAGQRQLLFHAAAQTRGEPVFEPVHIEHAQIAASALFDLIRRHAAQIADVANVFEHREIRIQAERLRQIPGVRARFASGNAEDFRRPGRSLHDAGEDLERGRLAGAVGADQTEDFAVADFKIDTEDGIDDAVLFREDREPEWRCVQPARSRTFSVPGMESVTVIC